MKKRADNRYVETATIDGKRRYFYGSTPAEAKRNLRAFEGERRKVRTFGEAADDWEASYVEGLRYNTQVFYAAPLKRAKAEFDGLPIDRLTPAMINNFLERLAKDGLGKRTVTAHLTTVKMICSRAVVAGDISVNPAREVKVPRGLASSKRELPEDRYIRIIDAHPEGEGLLMYFLLWTGCRRCEALAVTWGDINFETGRLTIDKIVEYHGNAPVIRAGAKTDSGVREMVIPDCLTEALRAAGPGESGEYIFGGKQPLTHSGFYETWNDYCLKYGLFDASEDAVINEHTGEIKSVSGGVVPHQLRHSYTTMLFEAGVDEKSAMAQTGHTDERTMKKIYTHLREKKKAGIADKLNGFSWKE